MTPGSAGQVAAAPVAVSNEAPKAPATAAPVSTNQLSKDLDGSKLSGPLFEHYDVAEEAIKVEAKRMNELGQAPKFTALQNSKSESEILKKQQDALFGNSEFEESIATNGADISELKAAEKQIKNPSNTNTDVEEEQYFKILDKAEAKMRAQLSSQSTMFDK